MRWRLVKKLLLQDAGSVKFLLSLQKFGAARRCRAQSFQCGQRTGREGIDIYKSVYPNVIFDFRKLRTLPDYR